MFVDGGSDYEYDSRGHQRYLFCRPYERLFQHEESEARRYAESTIRDWLRRIAPLGKENDYPPSKQILREHYPKMDFSKHPTRDWRRWRFFRYFLDLQGFHKGHLDLTPRTAERYNELIRNWEIFTREFGSISSLSVSVSAQTLAEDNSPQVAPDAPKPCPLFLESWDIPQSVAMDEIQDLIGKTLDVMANFPHPHFQYLFLLDLPTELLDMVFSFALLEDARNLSATCHRLRDVGQAYVFLVTLLERALMANASDEEELKSHVVDALSKGLNLCLDEIEFLLSRSYICSRILDLQFGIFLPTSTIALGHDACGQLFSDLTDRFADLLSRIQLRKLEIIGVRFELAHARGLMAQSALSECTLDDCSTSAALREHILGQPTGTFDSNFLESLTIIVDPDDRRDTFWPLIAMFPRLRLLHIYPHRAHSENSTFWAPDPFVWVPLSRAFNTVERLSIEGIRTNPDLRDVFRVASLTAGSARLTHFKLQDVRDMAEGLVIDILHALHSSRAPLEVLALDGIRPISTDFFDVVSQLFPDLRGLTVVRYAGKRKAYFERRRTPWERPLHEYAAYFRRFTRLRHFGANFYWDDDARSPRAIDIELNRDAYADSELYDIQMIDFRAVVLPFAAYCPSLTSMRVACDSSWSYEISRSESGGIITKEPPPPFLASSSTTTRIEPYELWEPSASYAWTLPEHEASTYW
ncbi:hypothetical protein AURDEDRAFT_121553 [Auricularia subglabra TFB-10046 SS5]|nr:hypothetical protein AURDEDRAFT_121553 [Auricularia subglabra TFB-10046 SS5]